MSNKIECMTVEISCIIVKEFIDPKVESGNFFSQTEVIKSTLRDFEKNGI